jgi:hypothetical protein
MNRAELEYLRRLEKRIEQLETKELHRFSKVGIGMVPVYPLDILGSGINVATTRTDNGDKVGRLLTSAYDVDEEPVASVVAYHRSGINEVRVGGGSSLFNASTLISFYTAANAATLDGTERLRITSDGDVFSEDWTDYSATSTVVGWSSTTILQIYYKRIGKLVLVAFDINGTSNSATATFTLPHTSAGPFTQLNGILVRNNGATSTTPGRITILSGGVTCQAGLNMSNAAGFTASGEKRILGQFWYEAA